jgi:hypothetical protein
MAPIARPSFRHSGRRIGEFCRKAGVWRKQRGTAGIGSAAHRDGNLRIEAIWKALFNRITEFLRPRRG